MSNPDRTPTRAQEKTSSTVADAGPTASGPTGSGTTASGPTGSGPTGSGIAARGTAASTRGTAASTAGRVPRGRRRWSAGDLALIAVFAALVAASISVPGIPVGPLGVPITLQTLAVALCGLVLGFGRGTAAISLYVLLGLVGLPIFSGFRAGPAILAGPSAGYIIGFILATAAVGLLAPWALRRRGKAGWLFAAATVGMLVVHGCGVLGFLAKGMGFWPAVVADAAYYPGDIIKNVLAVAVALSLHRAFPDILLRRRK